MSTSPHMRSGLVLFFFSCIVCIFLFGAILMLPISCDTKFQVPQVTEEAALAVVDLYPTVLSLARAYSLLVGILSCLYFQSLCGF